MFSDSHVERNNSISGTSSTPEGGLGDTTIGVPQETGNSTRILALETSAREASVAAIEADGNGVRLLREVMLAGSQRTAQVLAPAVRDLLAAVGWTPADVQLVAVAVGPGSFTGLRIGVTMAKTFAYAVGAEVIGVNTLAVLAEQAGSSSAPLWTVMDAQRQELFAAKWEASATDGVETRILPESDWLAMLAAGDRVTGPALRKIEPQLPAEVEAVDASLWQPLASAVGTLAWREYQAGRRDDLWKLVPAYYRLSAAEEKRGRQGDMETR